MNQIKNLCVAFCLLCVVFFATSCYNGSLCWADNSVTQTNNIDVKVEDSSKKAFTYGADSDKRIAKYGELGELTQINIKISGETSLDKLKQTTTGVDESGQAASDESKISYFTDWVKIKIRLPKGYAKYNILDGKGNVKIDKAKQVEDDYFKFNFEWVRLDKDKTSANLVVDDGETDKYLFYEFCDKDDKVLEHYFVRIVYDVKIKQIK